MAKLYELTGELIQLAEIGLEEDVDAEVFVDTLEAVEGEYDDKIEGYCKVIKNIEGDIDAVKKEIERLTARKKNMENNVQRMKDAMFNSMKVLGKTTAGGTILKASIQKNGGKLPLIVEKDAKDLPDEFKVVEFKPDNMAIREALECGRELEFAHFGERGETIRIK